MTTPHKFGSAVDALMTRHGNNGEGHIGLTSGSGSHTVSASWLLLVQIGSQTTSILYGAATVSGPLRIS